MKKHTLAVVFGLLVVIFAPVSTAQPRRYTGFAFVDAGPRAGGVGGAVERVFSDRLHLGAFVDVYSPWAQLDQPQLEVFALLHVRMSDTWVARLHLGVGGGFEGSWTPRGFLIVTTTHRFAPWVNIFASLPTDVPANTYAQVRVGMRVGITEQLLLIPYIEFPFAPQMHIPFANGSNNLGLTFIYAP